MEHIVGGVGTVLVLAAYFLVSTGRLESRSYGFQGMNFLGAGLLTVYAVLLFAWASVALNLVWGLIALVTIWRVFRSARGRVRGANVETG